MWIFCEDFMLLLVLHERPLKVQNPSIPPDKSMDFEKCIWDMKICDVVLQISMLASQHRFSRSDSGDDSVTS